VILLSLALVLASLGLLIGGLAVTSQVLVWCSLVASVGACACLLVSVLARRRGMVDFDGDGPVVPVVSYDTSPPGQSVWARPGQSWIPERSGAPERPALPQRPAARVDADSISPPTTPIPIPISTLPPAASPPAASPPVASPPVATPAIPADAAPSPAAPPSQAAAPPEPAVAPAPPASAAPVPEPAAGPPVSPTGPTPDRPAPYHRRQPVTSSARAGTEGDVAASDPVEGERDLFTPKVDLGSGPPTPRVTAEAPALGSPFRAPQEAALSGPSDEPPVEEIAVSVALRAAQLGDEVRVVDQRPRYHLGSCSWLGSRPTLPLPLSVARRSGFTPCGVCRPDSTLLARARATGRGPV
jgi:hypothetical protein